MCCRSGSVICQSTPTRALLPSEDGRRVRRTRALSVSANGSAKIKIGTPAARAVAPFCHPVIAVVANTKPKTRLPPSPRKMEAGAKLKEKEYYRWIFANEPEWESYR